MEIGFELGSGVRVRVMAIAWVRLGSGFILQYYRIMVLKRN